MFRFNRFIDIFNLQVLKSSEHRTKGMANIYAFNSIIVIIKMESLVILVLLVIFIERNKVSLSNLKVHDINAILSRKSRTTAYVPHQSGISVCRKKLIL